MSEEIEPGIKYDDLKYPTRQQMRLEIARLRARPSPSEEALRKAAVLLVDESERILFAKQENGGDHPGLALALTRMNAALSSSAPVSEAKVVVTIHPKEAIGVPSHDVIVTDYFPAPQSSGKEGA